MYSSNPHLLCPRFKSQLQQVSIPSLRGHSIHVASSYSPRIVLPRQSFLLCLRPLLVILRVAHVPVLDILPLSLRVVSVTALSIHWPMLSLTPRFIESQMKFEVVSKALQVRQSPGAPPLIPCGSYISVANAPTKIVPRKMAFRLTIVLVSRLVLFQWLAPGAEGIGLTSRGRRGCLPCRLSFGGC